MSTRASIQISDGSLTIWLRRETDGYPIATDRNNRVFGVMPDLVAIRNWTAQELIRPQASDAAGWLLRMGVAEQMELQAIYPPTGPPVYNPGEQDQQSLTGPPPRNALEGGKPAAYIITDRHNAVHQARWHYRLDVRDRKISCRHGRPDVSPDLN